MTHIDHISHVKPGFKPYPERLHVITPVFNPHRYASRYKLFYQFEQHMKSTGVILHVIEAAFGGRPFEVTDPDNPNHIQVRTNSVLWLKENMINLAISKIAADYLAWVDCDFHFVRPDFAQETLQKLQHYPFVQMFSHIQNVTNDFELQQISHATSFMYGWQHQKPKLDAERPRPKPPHPEPDPHPHPKPRPHPHPEPHPHPYPRVESTAQQWFGPPGGAWAARREALDKVGGLIDWGIMGSNDYYMARGLVGTIGEVLHSNFHEQYNKQCLLWQDRADRFIRHNIGYVSGLVIHHWHGKYANRGYETRNDALIKYQFNPMTDLIRNSSGLYELVDHGGSRSKGLRDSLDAYFASRNEDSIDI